MSNNTYYNIYLNNNIELARSLIIKLDIVADAMNQELVYYGEEISSDRYTWRYYKHLAGEYHSIDKPMMIISLDTGEEIIMSKDSFRSHKKTRALYLSEPNYIIELVRRYPSQSNLIKGIMHPIDIDTVVTAKDGAVLYYDANFVEGQEYNLIPDIEKWIAGYLFRTNMQSYSETDDLFRASVCGLLYINLPQVIMNIRLRYVKTAMVHSFHISSYLASYNRLDEFIPYLTFEQQLFLYLNIDYIVNHTGMSETFDTLVEKLMTIRNLPVFDYTLQQAGIKLEEFELQPSPVFIRNKVNLDSGLTTRTLDVYDITTILNKEAYQAKDNYNNLHQYTESAKTLSAQSSISKLPTKIVEVSAIDPEDTEPSKLPEVIINEWAYHASNRTYRNTVEIINPLNGDPVKLSVADTFLLFLYGYGKGYFGMELEEIPLYHAYDVAKHTWIPASEYLSLAPNSDIGHWDRDVDFFVNSNMELEEPILLASDFLDRCIELNSRRNTRIMWVENNFRVEDRATNYSFFNHSYKDVWCKIDQGNYKTYSDFFLRVGLNASMIDNEMWKDIAMDCLNKSTAFSSSNTISLREVQANMVRLFKRLSSYTIQFLEEIASNESMVAGSTIIIPDETGSSRSATAYIPNPEMESLAATGMLSYDLVVNNDPVDSLYVEYDNGIDVSAEIGVVADCTFEIVSNCTVMLDHSKVLNIIKEE